MPYSTSLSPRDDRFGRFDDLGDSEPEGAPSHSCWVRVDAVEKVGGVPSRSCWGLVDAGGLEIRRAGAAGRWMPARRLEDLDARGRCRATIARGRHGTEAWVRWPASLASSGLLPWTETRGPGGAGLEVLAGPGDLGIDPDLS